jgi:hypothetical protein
MTIATLGGLASSLAAQETYDLTGKFPEPKSEIRTDVKMEIAKGRFVATAGTATQEGTIVMTGKRVEEIKFLKKGGREKNRYEHTIVKDETDYSFAFAGDPILSEFGSIKRVDPLEGRTIRFLEYADGWQKTLQGKAPDKAQRDKIAIREPWETGQDLFPEEPIAVGTEWEEEGGPLLRVIFGENWVSKSGVVEFTFEKIEKFRGENCALVLVEGDFVGRGLDNSNNDITYHMNITGTIHRSLESRIDRQIELKGDAKLVSSLVSASGVKANVEISGPIEILYLARMK